MSIIPGFPALLAVRPPPVLTFRSVQFDTVDRTVYTFSGLAIGDADDSRWVMVAPRSAGIGTPSVTINSVPCDVFADYGGSVSLQGAPVPGGTTATVVVTYPGSAPRCGLALWTVTGNGRLQCIGSDYVNGGGPPASVDLPIVPSSVSIAAGVTGSASTWTNATERYDQFIEGSSSHSGADYTNASTTTGTRTITCSAATSMVGASFR